MCTDKEFMGGRLLVPRAFAPSAIRDMPACAGGTHGGVRCGHPLIYPVAPEDLSAPLRSRSALGRNRYLGAVFAFDLEPLPAGWLYTGARFVVALSGPGSRAVQVTGAGDEPATQPAARTIAATGARSRLLHRLAARRHTPRAWATGTHSGLFGWIYQDVRGRLRPGTYAMHALLEIPVQASEVTGTLSVQVQTSGPGGQPDGELVDVVSFAEPVTAAPAGTGAAVRLCLAADVVGYSGRANAETARLQRDLVDVLGRARRAAGIRDAEVHPQKQGDGQFTVLPVGIDESAVIPDLLAELGACLLRRNRGLPAEQRMRLRVALHRGLVAEGANGWVGTAAIAVHRILDSDPLRDAVRQHPAAAYVLGVPDVLYRDVIAHVARPPLPADFRQMTVELPAKNFRERGWLHLGPEVST